VGGEKYYYIERDPGDTSSGRFVHWKSRLHDVNAGSGGRNDIMKVWLFNYDPAVWNIGLVDQYFEKTGWDLAIFGKFSIWTRDAANNPYIATLNTSFDRCTGLPG
jgi:hypothetical protein